MTTWKKIFALAVWLAVCFSAAGIGSGFRPGQWYEQLIKPGWTPPDAVFAPVWTMLYLFMGIAAWLVWRRTGFKEAWPALVFFLVQLALNSMWSFLFFGLHRIDLALIEIVLLWGMILITMVLFGRLDRIAGLLMLPYWLWVGYAISLNLAVWRLN